MTFYDLQFFDALLYQSLNLLLSTEDVDTLGLTFEVETHHELVENGASVPVTCENKRDFVERYWQWKLCGQVATRLAAVTKGMYEVIPQTLLSVFDYQELELLMGGQQMVLLRDWKAHTQIWSSESVLEESKSTGLVVVMWFWETLHGFTNEERAKVLQYVTGSSVLPVQGFKVHQVILVHRS